MSARDVIDLTLMGMNYHGTEGTANAIISALSAAGYAVVPREPTQKMIQAAAQLDFSAQHDPTWPEYYAAMIAAAEPPDA